MNEEDDGLRKGRGKTVANGSCRRRLIFRWTFSNCLDYPANKQEISLRINANGNVGYLTNYHMDCQQI